MAVAEPLTITEAERRELGVRAGQYTRPYREVIRAKLVLLCADGLSDVQIAEKLDVTDRMVAKWRKRFRTEGLAGLDEKPRPGRPRSFSPLSGRRSQSARLRTAS